MVLRRQPVRIVDGQPESGYASMYEIICCDCGDHPRLDYREVPLVASGSSSRNANGTRISKNSMATKTTTAMTAGCDTVRASCEARDQSARALSLLFKCATSAEGEVVV